MKPRISPIVRDIAFFMAGVIYALIMAYLFFVFLQW